MKYYFNLLFALLLSAGLFPAVCAETAAGEIQMSESIDRGKWIFTNGPEYPGARGNLKQEGGKLLLNADFRKGGVYVGFRRTLATPVEVGKLNFTVKGIAGKIAVRFVDSTGQTHQHFLEVNGKSRNFSVPVSGSPQHHWGGARNGVFKGPLREYAFVVHNQDMGKAKNGTAEFSNISITSSDPRIFRMAWAIPSPESLFRRPGDKTPVNVRVYVNAGKIPGAADFIYSDYTGRTVSTGKARYDEAAGQLQCPPPAGRGYYELSFPALEIRLGVAVDTPPPARPDEYFAIDGSFSWGTDPGNEADIRSYLRILKDNGIIWNRDRLHWSKIQPQKDQFNFGERAGLYRRIAAEEGIRTLDTFHDTPAWNRVKSSRGNQFGPHTNLYPDNLQAAGSGLATILSYWGNTIDALEVWNEPDIGFGNNFPAAYVTAFTKAVSYAVAELGLKKQIVGGVFASPRETTGFFDTYVRNGLLDDCDVISYHTYLDTPAMEQQVVALRAIEAKYGYRPGIPLWITECGKAWTRGDYRASVPDDIRSAAEIVGKAAELRALGLERYFAFEYKYYDEHRKNFGMMDAKYTPMRSMAAFSHCARALAHRNYIGDLKIADAVRARVFEGENDLVAVLYCGVEKSRRESLALPAQLPVLRATGADGRPFEISGLEIPLHDGIAYLYLPKTARNKQFIDAGTEAMKLYQTARKYRRLPRAAKPLVLQPVGDTSAFLVNRYGFYIKSYNNIEFKVRVNNLSRNEITFRPEIELPAGMKLLSEPKATPVPRHGNAEVTLRLSIDPTVNPRQFRAIVFKDRGGMATPIAFYVQPHPVEKLKVRSAAATAADSGWVDFGGPEYWTPWQNGAVLPDIGAKLRAFYTPDELIIQVKVSDSSHHNGNLSAEAWQGDSLQITLQQRKADGSVPAKRSWHEITAANCSSGNTLFEHIGPRNGLLDASKLKFRHDGNESFYELRFNADELGLVLSPGSRIGSTVLVNSNSGHGRAGFLSWGGGIADQKSDQLFNLLELE